MKKDKDKDNLAAHDQDYYNGRVYPGASVGVVIIASLVVLFLLSVVVCYFSSCTW